MASAQLLHQDLFQFLREYSSLVPPHAMTFPNHLPPSTVHDFLVQHILSNPHFQKYPPSEQYQKSFWKWAIRHLENVHSDEDAEIDSRIFEHYLSLMPPSGPALGIPHPQMRALLCPRGLPLQAPPSESYVTHFWEPSPDCAIESERPAPHVVDVAQYSTATLLESRTTIESGTTGLRTWLASFFLSQYLIQHPGVIDGKRILELGSGTGFMGVIVASLQQRSFSKLSTTSLWMTDVNENVLTRCRDNIQLPCNLSSLHPNLNYRLLDWSAALDSERAILLGLLLHDEIDPDLILGADIVFDPSLIPALAGVLKISLTPSRSAKRKTALIALTIRNADTFAQFLDHIRQQSLDIEELEMQMDRTLFMETVDIHNDVKIFKITGSKQI